MEFKIHFTVLFLLIGFSGLKAQDLFSTAGKDFTDGNTTLSSSFGEPITITFQDNHILTQGFQQPNYRIVSSTDFPDVKSFEVKIYPNPTDQLIHASFFSSKINGSYQWQVYTLVGEVLKTTQAIEGETTELDLSFLSAGSYFLILKDEQGQNIATRKIQKIR